ncbi:hypothetical protein [Bacillus sp. UNC438CL73TsuS30]|uniref:hypothetical protein n=1 Tax=Bacillus sp. UNC438CL73TsuS30 TaxID=1340434 RepID=UPI00047BB92E|nr:hypothetical protein [Bacillus sp. UNC438CL73TsuS30]
MIFKEMEKFEEFLSRSFADGVNFRELRLSQDEVSLVKKRYPKANVKQCQPMESVDGKNWYEINLLFPVISKDETEIEAVQRENRKLRQELETLKKSVALF